MGIRGPRSAWVSVVRPFSPESARAAPLRVVRAAPLFPGKRLKRRAVGTREACTPPPAFSLAGTCQKRPRVTHALPSVSPPVTPGASAGPNLAQGAGLGTAASGAFAPPGEPSGRPFHNHPTPCRPPRRGPGQPRSGIAGLPCARAPLAPRGSARPIGRLCGSALVPGHATARGRVHCGALCVGLAARGAGLCVDVVRVLWQPLLGPVPGAAGSGTAGLLRGRGSGAGCRPRRPRTPGRALRPAGAGASRSDVSRPHGRGVT